MGIKILSQCNTIEKEKIELSSQRNKGLYEQSSRFSGEKRLCSSDVLFPGHIMLMFWFGLHFFNTFVWDFQVIY